MQNEQTDRVRILHSEGLDWEEIETKLVGEGLSEDKAKEYIAVVRKEKQSRNRSRGMLLLLAGSAMCFISMVFTFFFGHDNFMLYGLTLIGVSLAFAGLVYIMG